ncbi:VWA domain-containing protein [Natronomonas gomsonensis]|uniref:VWA domain-containing protein n=1 Tax=Natronomonas gomsonensis TaxID=1046043 RepID=UPI0015C014D6|nr:VWA domain-containing protein [Natronomonas gomsonensis]
MERRKFLIGVGGASLGSGALVGSGAFSAMRAERPVSIQVSEDPGALVGLDRCPGSDNAKYAGVDDDGELFVDISEKPNEGDGVNGDSVYLFHEVFRVCNQSDHSICLWVERENGWPEVDSGPSKGDPRVDFYLGADPDDSILGASNGHELDSGDCVCIGIKTNTVGLTSAEADTILEPVGDDINLRADSECPDGVEQPPQENECVPCSVSESDGNEDFLTIESVDDSNFPEVTVTARVETDAGGDGDLKAEDFTLCETFEGDNFGQDPTVAFAGEDERAEADVMILMDTSGSMDDEDGKFPNAKDGAETLVNNLGPGVNVGLAQFPRDGSGTPDAEVLDPLGTDKTDIKSSIDSLTADGGTPMEDGINVSQQELENNGRDVPAFMVVLANGVESFSSDAKAAANTAKGDGTTIISIAYGDDADEELMLGISSPPKNGDDDDAIQAGDENAFVGGQDDIANIFEDIGEIISGTYALTYQTCNPDPSDSTREVLLHVEDSQDSRVATDTKEYTLPST